MLEFLFNKSWTKVTNLKLETGCFGKKLQAQLIKNCKAICPPHVSLFVITSDLRPYLIQFLDSLQAGLHSLHSNIRIQTLSSSRLLSKHLEIRIYKTIILNNILTYRAWRPWADVTIFSRRFAAICVRHLQEWSFRHSSAVGGKEESRRKPCRL